MTGRSEEGAYWSQGGLSQGEDIQVMFVHTVICFIPIS